MFSRVAQAEAGLACTYTLLVLAPAGGRGASVLIPILYLYLLVQAEAELAARASVLEQQGQKEVALLQAAALREQAPYDECMAAAH